MSAQIDVALVSGLTGAPQPLAPMLVTLPEIGTASSLFGSNYILRMGLHFDRYIISGYLPWWSVIQNVYAAANPQVTMARKKRATVITGNIGESVVSIIARRYFGYATGDIQPINAGTVKSPDFRIAFRPMVPASINALVAGGFAVGFTHWPVESKAAATLAGTNRVRRSALQQLGAYWFQRALNEPQVVGYGIICCFIYRGTQNDPMREVRIHVITPLNQVGLANLMQGYVGNGGQAAFLDALVQAGSPVRGCLRNA